MLGQRRIPKIDIAVNYFNYFTEIEEHFQRRRGSLLLLSTLDWALIETWREAGVPLAAVVRGIDTAFDRYDARKGRTRARKINGLAWCAQEVMAAVEDLQEAAVGGAAASGKTSSDNADGFEAERIAAHLRECAAALAAPVLTGIARETADETAERLEQLAAQTLSGQPKLEDLERELTAMEEKLLAALKASSSAEELLQLRERAAQELAPYRSRMQALQIRQVEQQFLNKRLLEKWNLPRLSLFYMRQS